MYILLASKMPTKKFCITKKKLVIKLVPKEFGIFGNKINFEGNERRIRASLKC
jgi:hypothetical protein